MKCIVVIIVIIIIMWVATGAEESLKLGPCETPGLTSTP